MALSWQVPRPLAMGSTEEAGRRDLFEHYIRCLKLDSQLAPDRFAADLASPTHALTGADIAYLCQRAAMFCVKDAVGANDANEGIAIIHRHFDAPLRLPTLGEGAGQRLLRRFEVHHTPKHASWLDVAEMEASLVSRECLGRTRIGHLPTLKSRGAAWRRRVEKDRRSIRWKFTVADARRVFRYDGIITPRSER